MNESVVDEITECMSGVRLPFYYYPGRYAPMLLSYFVNESTKVRELRNSPHGRLLDSTALKETMASLGDGVVTRDRLLSIWPPQPECYIVTLGKWGRDIGWKRMHFQTSRPGTNLVLHLNFSNKHNSRYQQLVRPKSGHPFECWGHPVSRRDYHTLAWARLDVDLDRGEALIEEIQSDWINLVHLGHDAVQGVKHGDWRRQTIMRRQFKRFRCNARALKRYIREVLTPHMTMWDEATLSAAIWFLREELGVRRIFYHTFLTGNVMKGISKRFPPRSLYTDLPKRFCFRKTHLAPAFVADDNRMRVQNLRDSNLLRFYLLELP